MTTCTLKILILISSWWWAYYISSREYKSLIEVHLLDCIIVRNSLHYSEPTLFPRSLGSLSQFKTHTHIQCTYQSLTVALALQPTLPNDMWTEVEQCRFWAWALKDLIHFNCLLQLCHLPFEETPPPPTPHRAETSREEGELSHPSPAGPETWRTTTQPVPNLDQQTLSWQKVSWK